jgi:mono/diheme cytochrome c family protein
MSRNWRAVLVSVLLSCGAVAQADESSVTLAAGDGVERVQANCAICHSLDYIVMNSPFQDRAGWEKTVTKMVKVMGAPLAPEDTAAVVDYLDRHYGKGAAPAAP